MNEPKKEKSFLSRCSVVASENLFSTRMVPSPPQVLLILEVVANIETKNDGESITDYVERMMNKLFRQDAKEDE